MAGAYPKPTALKLLEGNPGKRKLNDEEPRPTVTTEPPSWLSDKARRVWEQLAPKLAILGILTDIDIEALGRYCDAMVVWLELSKFINKNGTSYAIPALPPDPKSGFKGRPARVEAYPQSRQYVEYSTLLLRLEMQFGMTPAMRSKIRVESPELKLRGFGQDEDDLNS